jgi:hypothetical protein
MYGYIHACVDSVADDGTVFSLTQEVGTRALTMAF